MSTEATTRFQTLLEEIKAMATLGFLRWCLENPGCALIVILVACAVGVVVYAVFQGVIELIKNRIQNVKRQKRLERRISTCGAPALTDAQRKFKIPQKLVDLAKSIEAAPPGDRFRACVVCADKIRLESYALQFYARIEQATTVDHYGWVYYDPPTDSSLELNIQNCLFEDLKICTDKDLPSDRFRAFVEIFDDPTKHILLVIRMCQNAEDRRLAQIANLQGLSVVLFSTDSVDGYDSIEIPVKGGNKT